MYTCPMHPEIRQKASGRCPKCGMNLVKEQVSLGNDYTPLIVIVVLITLTTLVLGIKDHLIGNFILEKTISHFMIGFFLIFGGIKLFDLKGFAEGYSTYDLLAKRFIPYAYFYPFIELFFAFSMIWNYGLKPILIAEVLIMSFSGLGVVIKLLKREKFQCVCLGTVLKVPLTYVTLIENFGMAFLALLMFLL